MSWPAAVIWFFVVAAAFSPGPALLYVLAVTGVFGSLQMLPSGASGGTNILPQSICAAVFVAKVLLQRGNLVRSFDAALDPRRVGLFTAFTVFSLLSAIVLPRLFNGQIEVVPVAYVSGTSLLAPSSANMTQSGYMLISFATTLAFSILGSRREFQRHFLMALLAGAVALLLTGLADLGAYYAGVSRLLDPFRTASYTLLADVEAVGSKRVVGLTPEASVYGTFCVDFAAALLFLRPIYPPIFRRVIVPITIIALLAMTIACTSSSAYVGLAVLALVYAGNLVIRSRSPDPLAREGMGWELVILAIVAFAIFSIVVFVPYVLDPLTELVDTMVLQKTSSASYIERSGWTRVGMQALLDSGGLGVGLGSIRTSNWFVSILASTGVFGGLLMFSFVVLLLLRDIGRGGSFDGHLRGALRLCLIPFFIMAALGGTIPDIGIIAASYFGMLTADA